VVIDTSPRSRTGTNSGIMHLFAATASIIAQRTLRREVGYGLEFRLVHRQTFGLPRQ
jgi:hypothetical protein